MTIAKITLHKFEVYGLRDGFFYLDGGAMFGTVPKVLWEKKCPADNKNRIKVGLNSILIDNKKDLILVETGIGSSFDQKFYEYYSIQREPGLIASLQKLGIEPEDIDIVINTHLHFDHCGGNTYCRKKGEFEPTFPRARYIIQKGEWKTALHPNARDKASYLKQFFLPLKDYRLLELVEGNTSISEGVEVVLAPGHTAFHQCVKVRSGEETLFFLGDMVPTSAHLGLPYIMSYDLFPLDTLKNKEKTLDQAVKEDWILAFNHDPQYYFGRVKKEKGKYFFHPLAE